RAARGPARRAPSWRRTRRSRGGCCRIGLHGLRASPSTPQVARAEIVHVTPGARAGEGAWGCSDEARVDADEFRGGRAEPARIPPRATWGGEPSAAVRCEAARQQ